VALLVDGLSRSVGLSLAAAYVGFNVQDFEKWVQLGILPAADPNTCGWRKENLDQALSALAEKGWPAHRDLPGIQRQPRTDGVGLKKYHHYRRGVPGALEGEPGSGVYMASLIAKNRQFALRHAAARKAEPAPPQNPIMAQPNPADRLGLPNLLTEHIGGMLPAAGHGARGRRKASRKPPLRRTLPENLPLYPEEYQLAAAILGPDRAEEWRAIARMLEREGLPLIDPLMGARFWPAVREFFESRNGLDERIVAGVKLPAVARVRCVPFVPDGKEVLDGEEASADPGRGRANRPQRPRP
jgi:hypothetical protein